MSKSITLCAALFGLLFAGAASAAENYLATPRGVAVNAYGECWRGASWTKEDAIEQCDPQYVTKMEPVVEVAAVETTTVLTKKEVNLSAETLFGFDEAELTMEGMKTLDGVAASAAEVPNQTIRITGHTDRIGPLEHNKQLSMRRAEAVRDYLAAKGFSAANMSVAGVGPDKPMVTCEGKRGQELIGCLGPNRRTDVEFAGVEMMQER